MTYFLFGFVVLVTHFLEGITGFGCTVLALPFCVMLVGVKTAVPVLTVLSLMLSSYIVFIDYKNIVWKSYLRIISFVGLGLPIGMLLFSFLPEDILRKILGAFMILVAARGIYFAFNEKAKVKEIGNRMLNFILFLGGIIHGAFSAGGPFVVIYATQALKNKSNFRATLSTLWVTLNSVIIIKIVLSGAFTPAAVTTLGWSVPFLIAGMLLGNWAHKRIDDRIFTKVVFLVLLVAGFFMLT
ncbi:MAG: hypothetical protein H6Q58_1534 [Firmicutes bacterium]|nr:hypothetical protein [Bacillota bacterium]